MSKKRKGSVRAGAGADWQFVQSARQPHPFEGWLGYTPLAAPDYGLYTAMREAIPVIDAALDKIVRLTGGFEVECGDQQLQAELNEFVQGVRVGACSYGLHQFAAVYLDSLLTYGNAVGEMVLNAQGDDIAALYNARFEDVRVKVGKSPLDIMLCAAADGLQFTPVRYPALILFTPMNPPAGEVRGVSLLRSLPFVSKTLMKIFGSIGVNFERVANLRYAVTYRPGAGERAPGRTIAEEIAREWADAMESQQRGVIKDFVAVGDLDIRVIGADNQMLESEVPVRQMLEQIVAKLGIPPFMLGLHWSSTERMSTQQADILTSELWSYRRLMEIVLRRILDTWLALRGSGADIHIRWDDINLQDEVEAAQARLVTAQAAALERQILEGGSENEAG